MKRMITRNTLLASVLTLTLAGAGLPMMAQAQDATPMASPEAGPPMEMPPAPEWAEVVATGLANPRGMEFGDDGALYIAEAGVGGEGPCAMGPEGNEECFGLSGGVTKVSGEATERVVDGLASRAAAGGQSATGPNDVAVMGDAIYVLIGLGGDPATRVDVNAGSDQLGYLFVSDADGLRPVIDVAGYETENNPDAAALDANPYSMVLNEDGSALITDAGMNALLLLGEDGELSTLSVFPDETGTAPDGSEIPMNAVPTGVAVAQDGSTLVGQLTGFPFPVGAADVFSVADGGGDPAALYDGFTTIIDVQTAPDGSVYVLEMLQGGMLGIDPADPSTLDGRLTRIAPDGTRTVVASDGLTWPTGLAIDDRGVPYVAVYGVMGNMGQVWKITPPA